MGAADLPPCPPTAGGGGDDGDEDAENKRWAEFVGMDIAQGREGENNKDNNNDNNDKLDYGEDVTMQRRPGKGGGRDFVFIFTVMISKD